MNLLEWRAQQAQGEAFVLPSGLVVRLRRVSLLDLMIQGQVPAPLVGMVETITAQASTRLTADQYAQFAEAINLVLRAAMIDPPVADEPGDGALGVNELAMADKLTVFNWVHEPAEGLRPFCPAAG